MAVKKREIILDQKVIQELVKRGIDVNSMKASIKKIDGRQYLVIESNGKMVKVALEERDGRLVGVRVEE